MYRSLLCGIFSLIHFSLIVVPTFACIIICGVGLGQINIRKKRKGKESAGTWLITLLRLGGQSWCASLVAEIPESHSATTQIASVDCTSDFSNELYRKRRKTESL